METKNIDRLKQIKENRNGCTGYIVNGNIRINYDKLRYVTLTGQYDNLRYDRYIIEAIREKEEWLLKRAAELEELDYQETKHKARLEATNILADSKIV